MLKSAMPLRSLWSAWADGARVYFGRMAGGGPASSGAFPMPSMCFLIWSVTGVFLGLIILSVLHYKLALRTEELILFAGNFGPQAYLIFAFPKSPLSQPWNCIMGNIICAFIGVCMAKLLYRHSLDHGIEWLIASLTVALSVLATSLARCPHTSAPGLALIIFLGTDRIRDLGFLVIIFPAALGAIVLVLVGMIFNNLSSDVTRHYPTYWKFWPPGEAITRRSVTQSRIVIVSEV